MLAKKCDVKVHKGALTVIPKTVYAHEIKLLEVLYGVGAVVMYDRREIYTPPEQSYIEEGDVVKYNVEEIDHDDEYSRLFLTYGNHPTINLPLVEHCYGDQDGKKLESINNERYSGERHKVVKNGLVGESKFPVDSEEMSEKKEKKPDYAEMTNMKLKLLLKERGVRFPHNITKTRLLDLCEKHFTANGDS